MTIDPDDLSIHTEGLTKIYPAANASASLRTIFARIAGRRPAGRPALAEIDLSIRAGEAVGIVGRNGSGKSTLLKTLAGALRPTEGHFIVRGRVGTLLDLGSGIHPEYTGAENAVVLGMLAGLSRSEVQERMPAIREFSGLGESFDRPAKTYSSGMSLRLGFSAAIHAEPQVLLIDEALAVGDAFFQQRCLARLRRLREAGTTIVLVSHDPSAVVSLCDRCVWLESGRVRADGAPSDVIRQYLAARYRDDCLLDAPLDPGPNASPESAHAANAERTLRPAAAIGRYDERFGDGRARIVGFEVRDANDEPATSAVPGGSLSVVISIEASERIAAPLVGFTIRNRLGDIVTATNTELEASGLSALQPRDQIDVAFDLPWPSVSSGSFSFSPAIAEGSIDAHRMCDWVENAWILEVENVRGLFGWMALDDVRVVSALRTTPPDGERSVAEVDTPSAPLHIEFALESPRSAIVEQAQITRSNEIFIAGWCFSTSGGAVRIRARAGDLEARTTEANGFRQDVAAAHADFPSASRSGFGLLVPLPYDPGPTPFRLEAIVGDQTKTVYEVELDVPAPLRILPSAISKRARRRRAASDRARILFVSHSLNLEGAPRSLFEMAAGLDASRFERRVVAPVDGPLGEEWVRAGIPVDHLAWNASIESEDDFDAQVRRLAGLVSTWKPDLIVANTLDAFWAIHVASELGRPAIWIVRESEPPDAYFHSRLDTPIAERARAALGIADRTVFVAAATRDLFLDDLPRARTQLIPNGLDFSRFDLSTIPAHGRRVRRELDLSPQTALLLCVGTTCVRKGQLDLIRALDKLRDSRPDFHCLFLGVIEGPYLDRMREEIGELALDKRVTLLSPVGDVRPYLAAADVTICNSYQESLPRVVMEAMGFGRPIVASRVFGIPELVRDESEALLIEPGDVESLAKAVERILADPTMAAAMGRRARERAEEHFSLEQCVRSYTQLFGDVLVDAVETEI